MYDEDYPEWAKTAEPQLPYENEDEEYLHWTEIDWALPGEKE